MKITERLKIWWRGVLPNVTEIGAFSKEGGAYRLIYPDPNYRTPRDRFLTVCVALCQMAAWFGYDGRRHRRHRFGDQKFARVVRGRRCRRSRPTTTRCRRECRRCGRSSPSCGRSPAPGAVAANAALRAAIAGPLSEARLGRSIVDVLWNCVTLHPSHERIRHRQRNSGQPQDAGRTHSG